MDEEGKSKKVDQLSEKLPIGDGNYELPCDPQTLGSCLPNAIPASHYETPTDAVRSPINNGIIAAVEANYELPYSPDSLSSPLQSVSPYETPSEATGTADVESSYATSANPDTLGSPLNLKGSPYEVPLDSCQSKFRFDSGVHTLPNSTHPDRKVAFHKPFASNTLAVVSSTDHNYEEPDFPANSNYELPIDGIDSNYEMPEELPKQNDNYDTVADGMDDTVRPLINIYDAPCS